MRLIVFLLLFVFSSCASKRPTVLRNPSSTSSVGKGVAIPTTTSTSSSSKTVGTSTSTSALKGGVVSASGIDYIARYNAAAIREMNQYGIPASIKLAQALLESANGNSYLAREANNHFGIKCGGAWSGKYVAHHDDSTNECFRAYSNVEDSYRDHSQFLLRKRYEKLFTLARDDYKGWAKGLKEAGYATNPRYPDLLIDLIERYDLHKYDAKESDVEKHIREDKVVLLIEEKARIAPNNEALIKVPVTMVIHEVKASQTLYSLGKQYNVSVDRIKQLNNLTNDNLSIGQLLVISK